MLLPQGEGSDQDVASTIEAEDSNGTEFSRLDSYGLNEMDTGLTELAALDMQVRGCLACG